MLVGELGELDPERIEVEPGDLLVELLGQHVDAERVLLEWLNSSIWASTWFENEQLMTKLGWPVAHPRFTSGPRRG